MGIVQIPDDSDQLDLHMFGRLLGQTTINDDGEHSICNQLVFVVQSKFCGDNFYCQLSAGSKFGLDGSANRYIHRRDLVSVYGIMIIFRNYYEICFPVSLLLEAF